jgi:hypothetical protein
MVQGAFNLTSCKPNPTLTKSLHSSSCRPAVIQPSFCIPKKKPPEGGFFLAAKEKLFL